MISVSKLCCPACWELLCTLRELGDQNDTFIVHGCHSIAYGLVLPPCLPREGANSVYEIMLAKYRGYLNREIFALFSRNQVDPSTWPTHKPKQESQTTLNLSIATGSSGNTNDIEFCAINPIDSYLVLKRVG